MRRRRTRKLLRIQQEARRVSPPGEHFGSCRVNRPVHGCTGKIMDFPILLWSNVLGFRLPYVEDTMNRRIFVRSAIGYSLAGVLLAQKAAKPGRLSGIVKSVDKSKMSIEMRGRTSSNTLRLIMYDANTKFTMQGKPGTADDVKDDLRIVANGTFEGVNLKATQIALTAQH